MSSRKSKSRFFFFSFFFLNVERCKKRWHDDAYVCLHDRWPTESLRLTNSSSFPFLFFFALFSSSFVSFFSFLSQFFVQSSPSEWWSLDEKRTVTNGFFSKRWTRFLFRFFSFFSFTRSVHIRRRRSARRGTPRGREWKQPRATNTGVVGAAWSLASEATRIRLEEYVYLQRTLSYLANFQHFRIRYSNPVRILLFRYRIKYYSNITRSFLSKLKRKPVYRGTNKNG